MLLQFQPDFHEAYALSIAASFSLLRQLSRMSADFHADSISPTLFRGCGFHAAATPTTLSMPRARNIFADFFALRRQQVFARLLSFSLQP